MQKKEPEYFMSIALKEAKKGLKKGEIPIGAVIICDNKIISKAHNLVETKNDATAHCELLAIRKAQKKLNSKYLNNCTIYVTIEPCPMCVGAIVWSKIAKIVYGANDPKSGACGSVINLANNSKLNHRCEIKSGILETDCANILKDFFKDLRLKKKQ